MRCTSSRSTPARARGRHAATALRRRDGQSRARRRRAGPAAAEASPAGCSRRRSPRDGRRGCTRARLASQVDVVPLYERAGFAVESGVFEEAGIPHVWMGRPWAAISRERRHRPAPTGMSPPPFVIFDCDGVLVDSESISNGVLAEMLAEQGLPMGLAEARARFQGLLLSQVLESAERMLGRPLPPGVARRVRRAPHRRVRRRAAPVSTGPPSSCATWPPPASPSASPRRAACARRAARSP